MRITDDLAMRRKGHYGSEQLVFQAYYEPYLDCLYEVNVEVEHDNKPSHLISQKSRDKYFYH